MSLQICSRPNVYFTGTMNNRSHTFEASSATPLFPSHESPPASYHYFGRGIAKTDRRQPEWPAVDLDRDRRAAV